MEQSKPPSKPAEAAGKGTADKDTLGASARGTAKRVLPKPAGLQFFSQYEGGDLVRFKTFGSEHHVVRIGSRGWVTIDGCKGGEKFVRNSFLELVERNGVRYSTKEVEEYVGPVDSSGQPPPSSSKAPGSGLKKMKGLKIANRDGTGSQESATGDSVVDVDDDDDEDDEFEDDNKVAAAAAATTAPEPLSPLALPLTFSSVSDAPAAEGGSAGYNATGEKHGKDGGRGGAASPISSSPPASNHHSTTTPGGSSHRFRRGRGGGVIGSSSAQRATLGGTGPPGQLFRQSSIGKSGGSSSSGSGSGSGGVVILPAAYGAPNPHSAYDELTEVNGLTLYDLHREPRPVLEGDASDYRKEKWTLDQELRSVRAINVELTCPICLGILQNTMVVMECLHRFCGDCIEKYLRVGSNPACPSCRVRIPTRRSLRADVNFDAIVSTIYPDLDDYSAREEKLFEETLRNRSTSAFYYGTTSGAGNCTTTSSSGSSGSRNSGPASSSSAPSPHVSATNAVAGRGALAFPARVPVDSGWAVASDSKKDQSAPPLAGSSTDANNLDNADMDVSNAQAAAEDAAPVLAHGEAVGINLRVHPIQGRGLPEIGKEGRPAKLRMPHHVKVVQIKSIILERLHALQGPGTEASIGPKTGSTGNSIGIGNATDKKENEAGGGSGGGAAISGSNSGGEPMREIDLTLNLARDPTTPLKTVVLDDNLTLRDIAQHFWKPPPGNDLADPEPWVTLNYRPVAGQ